MRVRNLTSGDAIPAKTRAFPWPGPAPADPRPLTSADGTSPASASARRSSPLRSLLLARKASGDAIPDFGAPRLPRLPRLVVVLVRRLPSGEGWRTLGVCIFSTWPRVGGTRLLV